MGNENNGKKSWATRSEVLPTIPVERPIRNLEDAKDPENIIWCIRKLSEGMTWEELRRRLGVGTRDSDPRWALMLREIRAQQPPKLTDEEVFEEITELEDLRREAQRLAELLEYDLSELKNTDKNYPALFKERINIFAKLLDANQKRLISHIESKRAEVGNKNKGITIHIHSNIPRPNRDITPGIQKLLPDSEGDE